MTITKAHEAMFAKMSIGNRLRWLMEDREIKQTELAAKIGITQSGVSNLVNDSARRPSAPTLMKIAEELRCNPNWLLTGEGDPFGWAPVTSDAQVELLNLYRSMDPDARKALIQVARTMKAGK